MASTTTSERQHQERTTGKTAADRSRDAHRRSTPKSTTDRDRGTRFHKILQDLCEQNAPVTIGDARKSALTVFGGKKGDPKRYSTTPDAYADTAHTAMRMMPPPNWKVIAIEFDLGNRTTDIIFEDEHGQIIVAEIKTGGHPSADHFEDAIGQFQDLADAAIDTYGTKLYAFAEIYVYAYHLSAVWPFGIEADREPLDKSGAWELGQRVHLPDDLTEDLEDFGD